MDDNEVLWEKVDYGVGSFHVVSYRRSDGRLQPTPEPPAVERAPDPCAFANWSWFRCWAASRADRAR